MLKGLLKEEEKIKSMNKKILPRTNTLTDKGKHLVKAVDQPTLKLVQRLKGKNRKVICTYNSKLRGAHTHTRSKKW